MTTGRPEQVQQGTLLDLAPTAVRPPDDGVPDPVAQVCVDVPLPHLDRPFDYLVPPEMAEQVRPGTRVQVRFAGKDRSAVVLARTGRSDHHGRLAPVRRVVSALPVLTPQVHDLCRAVADHYAGTLTDVLRLAVPPRHATTEKTFLERLGGTGPAAPPLLEAPQPRAWKPYTGGPAFLRHLAAGESPRAVWTALPAHPDDDVLPWSQAVAEAAAATLSAGRGVLVVVPTARHVETMVTALSDALPGVAVARLQADDGPSRRYRSFLQVLTGQARVVVGTRAAAFAPVADLGLSVCWDDGDDNLAEPRAPYPHTRQVLALRAQRERTALLLGGFARSVESHALVEQGWARPVLAPREVTRRATPRVSAPSALDLAAEGPAGAARIPHLAWRMVRTALADGPVLVQVARAGYVPVVACQSCREPARCVACHGPLRVDSTGAHPACSWCGRPAVDWACPHCHGTRLRATRVGSGRTAEELGRTFPSVPVVVSSATGEHGVVETVDARPRLVVATPGAEPVAVAGYTAALLLDAAASSSRPELWAGAEALRRWLNAAALVRPAVHGGRVMLLGDPAPAPAQALVRWDPAGYAERELAERADLRFPPATRMAAVHGPAAAVQSFLRHLQAEVELLGPVPVGEEVRALVRSEHLRPAELGRALAQAAAVRSARKEEGSVRVQVDPTELL
ncbi:primosomal protein N' [Georgenia sp. 10Sc9-8]|uniref:Probable replication restart protein PriA n=1 Tax=Georgenia halotolerans TaxID=3028317 RepID=A0ABT5U0D4_9MICO|nr:primosomal protein N' [Georgenia halotolerans]